MAEKQTWSIVDHQERKILFFLFNDCTFLFCLTGFKTKTRKERKGSKAFYLQPVALQIVAVVGWVIFTNLNYFLTKKLKINNNIDYLPNFYYFYYIILLILFPILYLTNRILRKKSEL